MQRHFPETFVTYRGQTVRATGWQSVPRVRLNLVTDDPSVAASLSLEAASPGSPFRFEGWVPAADLDRWVHREKYGTYQGVQVFVMGEDDASYTVESNAPFAGFRNIDRGTWWGVVAKDQMERTWEEEREQDLSQYRKS